MLDILHATSEVVPYSKTGGLADVSSALPRAQAALGHRVHVVTPFYDCVDPARHRLIGSGRRFEVTIGGRTAEFEVLHADMGDGVTVVFLRNDDMFGRPSLYGTAAGDYDDNHRRFAFFCAGIFRVMRVLRIRPDILHCHDWQTGLVPAFNRLLLMDLFPTVLTVHNLGYQGLFPAHVLPETGLPWGCFNPSGVEFYGKVGFLKAGLVHADRVTTVSPTYADEVRTPDHGFGLDGVLRARGSDFKGILNGADYEIWNPLTDPHIPANFSSDDLSGKVECRRALLAESGLDETDGPLFGVVGRLATQKGYDLLAEILPDLVEMGGSVVMLGTGEPAVEKALADAAARFPGRVALRIAYDDPLAHRIEAGCDFFLMPSVYEPCGLNQIYSMKYGTLPIVHGVGGLRDTVVDLDEDHENATGIRFSPFGADTFRDALRRAGALFRNRDAHLRVVRRAMERDFSWGASASAYLELYQGILR
jgi:starch synthase